MPLRRREAARRAIGPAGPRPRAFTLIELVLVLVIIAVVLAVSTPSLRGFLASSRASDSAASILALTHYARSYAVTQGRPCRLVIDADAGEFWLETDEVQMYPSQGSFLGRRFTLPDDVTLRLEVVSSEAAAPTTAGLRGSTMTLLSGLGLSPGLSGASPAARGDLPFVQFYPTGRCDLATFDIRDRDGELWQVTCPSVAERFYIISPAEETR